MDYYSIDDRSIQTLSLVFSSMALLYLYNIIHVYFAVCFWTFFKTCKLYRFKA